jgi:hypothetical protein
VRRAFEDYATGQYTKEQLLKRARTCGLTNRRGKPVTSLVRPEARSARACHRSSCVLNVSPSTAKREWRTAKAWLNRELGPEAHP